MFGIIFALASLAASATPDDGHRKLYKCKDDSGVTVFSEIPCGANSSTIDIAPDPHAKLPWRIEGAAPRDQAQACVDNWLPIMKDPGSVTWTDAIYASSRKERDIVVEGRARNGFGGMGFQYFVCAVDREDGHTREGSRLTYVAEYISKYGVKATYESWRQCCT